MLALMLMLMMVMMMMQAEARSPSRTRLVRGPQRFEGRGGDEQDAEAHARHVQERKQGRYVSSVCLRVPPNHGIP